MTRPADLERILQASSREHSHLCPRRVLGARMGLAGCRALGAPCPSDAKRVLVIAETDGCFLDGLSAATGCTPGHRTLRIEDYGKVAATFVDTRTQAALRLAPQPDIRTRSLEYTPGEPRAYHAQLQAYQVMPDEVLFSFTPVELGTPVATLLSLPRVRATCHGCGEEVINEREMNSEGGPLCRSCALGGYYQVTSSIGR